MTYEIIPSSPVAKEKAVMLKLPLETLEVGFSIKVELDSASESKLRTYVSRHSKRLNIKCTVIKHDDLGCIEIARIA